MARISKAREEFNRTIFKFPSETEIRTTLFTKIYGEWKGGSCANYVEAWQLHAPLFDAVLSQAGREMRGVELELFCAAATSGAWASQPSAALTSLSYGVMAEIINVLFGDSAKPLVNHLRTWGEL